MRPDQGARVKLADHIHIGIDESDYVRFSGWPLPSSQLRGFRAGRGDRSGLSSGGPIRAIGFPNEAPGDRHWSAGLPLLQFHDCASDLA